MGAPVPQLGSFRYAFEQRSKERLHLLSSHRDVHFHHHDDGDDDFDDYDFYDDGRCCFRCRRGFRRAIKKFDVCWGKAREFAVRAWEFGLSDPRNFVFAAKLGFALTLMSLLIFLKEPFKEVSRYSVWAILTVVVVFEFSIGSTLSKGFNRAIGTLSAGGLALGVAYLCTKAGELEEVFIIISIFTVGFITTFIKLYPTMKPYEYGFRVFLLTFCIIMVSGNRTRQFIETAGRICITWL